jgi:hypothetical protein
MTDAFRPMMVARRLTQGGGELPQANCAAASKQRLSQWLRLDQEVNQRL